MSKVRILPEILSNKIAAGEVVERPASVVKELVENSLDAGSSVINIEIEKGGRSLIRISDNGSGMGMDDALLAVERYATSKIYDDDDLFSINTLGFRGEALPSIASVSRFSLVTREHGSDTASQIFIEGGNVKKITETGAPPGTMITIEQLFYNTPARRKFLKTINTEMGHISDTIASIALGWPQVQFRITHNGKLVKSWPKASGPFDRAVDVLGNDLRNSLHEIGFEDDYLNISGLISSPDVTRSTSQKIFIYINGRYIKDRGLIHALFEGYGSRLMKGRFPVAVLFINIPFDQLDVNVHPTKHEVRFADHKRVFNAVKHSVGNTLTTIEQNTWESISKAEAKPSQAASPREQFTNHYRISDENQLFSDTKQQEPFVAKEPAPTDYQPVPESDSTVNETVLPKFQDRFAESTQRVSEKTEIEQNTIWEKKFFSDLVIIGQLHNSYILCDSGDGLIIIDQHAAHECIVYYELKNKKMKIGSQALLIPETLELGYKEAAALERVVEELEEYGLEIHPFGGNTFTVKSVPTILSEGAIINLVTEIAEKLVEIGHSKVLETAIDDCLILMACHGAIRANQPLTETQMRHLLTQLDACSEPSFCPHGRPTWTRWGIRTIEKSFKR